MQLTENKVKPGPCRRGEHLKAITSLEKAIEISPVGAVLYYDLGLVYGKKGEEDTAMEYFSKAIELAPEYAAPYFSRGFASQLVYSASSAPRW
ncbi:MAG: tetratricopeptide repeat protein [Elusimicrobiota bacterium]|nr:tetratricopeptide repeat protein [Elusimicrobiota bacterium]